MATILFLSEPSPTGDGVTFPEARKQGYLRCRGHGGIAKGVACFHPLSILYGLYELTAAEIRVVEGGEVKDKTKRALELRETAIPVTPALLTWARETAGYSISDVVEKLKRKTITSETIESWEKGEASPSYPCLKKLAYDIYKRPLALFFFPQPPDEEEPTKSFRTLSPELINEISPNMRFLLRKAKVRQLNLNELNEGVNRSPKLIWKAFSSFSSSRSISSFCDSLREFLGISLEEQSDWENSETALKKWRDVVEAAGVYVFKESFKEDDISGFCLYDEKFPIIYINNNKPKNRQIFTLFHELAHILLSTGGLDFVDFRKDYLQKLAPRQKSLEIKCDTFAAQFLVPDRDFNRRIAEPTPKKETFEKLAEHYCVSREVILRKFLDKKIIDQSYYNSTVESWYLKKPTSQGSSGGDFYANKNTYLGKGYLNVAFSRYYQNRISEQQLADYLELSRLDQIPQIEAYLSK